MRGQLYSLHLLNLLQGLSPARPTGKTDSQFFLLPHHLKPKSLLRALKGITIRGDTSSLPVSNEGVRGKETVKLSPSKSVLEKKEEEKEEGEKEDEKEGEKEEEKEVVVRRGGGMSVLGPEKFSHRIKQE